MWPHQAVRQRHQTEGLHHWDHGGLLWVPGQHGRAGLRGGRSLCLRGTFRYQRLAGMCRNEWVYLRLPWGFYSQYCFFPSLKNAPFSLSTWLLTKLFCFEISVKLYEVLIKSESEWLDQACLLLVYAWLNWFCTVDQCDLWHPMRRQTRQNMGCLRIDVESLNFSQTWSTWQRRWRRASREVWSSGNVITVV